MSLLNSALGQNNGITDPQFPVLDWPKLQKSQILFTSYGSQIVSYCVSGPQAKIGLMACRIFFLFSE
jgi:hypothetical protein